MESRPLTARPGRHACVPSRPRQPRRAEPPAGRRPPARLEFCDLPAIGSNSQGPSLANREWSVRSLKDHCSPRRAQTLTVGGATKPVITARRPAASPGTPRRRRSPATALRPRSETSTSSMHPRSPSRGTAADLRAHRAPRPAAPPQAPRRGRPARVSAPWAPAPRASRRGRHARPGALGPRAARGS
jgi:hypothetical protein